MSVELPERVETIFLDVGNTLIPMDFGGIVALLGEHGIEAEADQVARAEARARPAVSRFLHEGKSTEGADVRSFYLETALEMLSRETRVPPAAIAGVVAELSGRFSTPDGSGEIWAGSAAGAEEALARLARPGLILGVVSNSDGRVEDRLVRAGLRHHVGRVFDSARLGVEKPDPRIFEIALAETGSVAQHTIHVGDLYHVDVLGARAAGICGVLLDPLAELEELDAPRIARVADLPAFLGARLP